jgi:hypothetical protein
MVHAERMWAAGSRDRALEQATCFCSEGTVRSRGSREERRGDVAIATRRSEACGPRESRLGFSWAGLHVVDAPAIDV